MDRPKPDRHDPRVPRTLEYSSQCLPKTLEDNGLRFAGHVATEFFGAKLRYGELWDQVLRCARVLSDLGVRPGTKVALMLPNCPQTIIAYYATLWLGGVAVLTNPMYMGREILHQWGDAEAEVLVVLDHLVPKVEPVIPKTKIRKVLVTSLKEYLPFPLNLLYPLKARKEKLFTAVPYERNMLNFKHSLKAAKPDPPGCTVTMDDLALLQYTGGTTGLSKGVMLSHRNIQANVAQLAAWIPDLRWGEERMLAILPFFHVFGMTVVMNLGLYIGGTVILVPRFEVNQFLKILHKSKPTLFPGVPTLYVALVNHPQIRSYDLSSIRYCITGSAPMPLEVLRTFERLTGGTIIEGYGLTEASPVTHANPLTGARKPGTIGLPLPDTEARIMDLDLGEREMKPGETGELAIRGPQVMKRYWKNPEETEKVLRDGWLFTGDIAGIDDEGYVTIIDRKKDLILAGGYNIYPREIDEVLYEHPKILDAVAIGIPDPYRGETVKAYVAVKPGETLTEHEVIQFCKTRLAAYKVPKRVEFRDALPKTVVGKVLRKQLREEALQGEKGAEKGPDTSGTAGASGH
jgi:long-chain acyl-CoA synthetase